MIAYPMRRMRKRWRENADKPEQPKPPGPPLKYRPVDRRWLIDTIGAFWLILALGTMGLFVILEWFAYDIIDIIRERRVRP